MISAQRVSGFVQRAAASSLTSIPAGVAAASGTYVAANGGRKGDYRLPTVLRRLEKDFNLYGMIFGLGWFVHICHRSSAHHYQKEIDNPNNWLWYRRVVRVASFPFRTVIGEPLLTVPVYFGVAFMATAFVYLKTGLFIMEALQEEAEREAEAKRMAEARKAKPSVWSIWMDKPKTGQ